MRDAVARTRDFLLVGGTGFLGTHVARGLLAAGHAVTVLSRGRATPPEGTTALVADRSDPAGVALALSGRRFDVAVEFGAFDAPDLAWVTHVPAGAVGCFVMISTGQVYLVGKDARPPFVEDDATRSLSEEPPAGTYDHGQWTYGTGKRRAEQALREFRDTHGAPGVVLRLPIVQGEGDASLRLWGYLERLLDGGPLVLPDGGRQPTRFLYAGDLAPVLERLAEEPELGHFAYNLAQPDVVSLRSLLERMAAAVGVNPRLVDVSWERCRAAGLDERFSSYAGSWSSILDPGRAEADLGFRGTPSADYLPRIVHWHLDHRPVASHPGWALRDREKALAEEVAGAGDAAGPARADRA